MLRKFPCVFKGHHSLIKHYSSAAASGSGGRRILVGQEGGCREGEGVKRVCIPNRSTNSPERKREQKKRWFRNGQKWRTGCEGRISVVKRRNGLDRCLYRAIPRVLRC